MTEAGALARVIADGTITQTGYLGVSRLLNTTFFFLFLQKMSQFIHDQVSTHEK